MSGNAPLKSVGAAWTAWAADKSPSAGSEFLERISSWIQGTSAQLLRARWNPNTPRPTSDELEGRLRHHLEVVAETGEATYPEALELARRGLIDEIVGAPTPRTDMARHVARPRGARLS